MKHLNFHLNLSDHDYQVKLCLAEEWMWNGGEVTLQLKFRGREMYHQDAGMALINRMRQDLAQIGTANIEPKLTGKSINLILTPLPPEKRKRKFSQDTGPDAS